MTSTTLSPKFQVVIPKPVREALRLEPGIRFHVVGHDGRIELIPFTNVKKLRGFLKGIDTRVPREKDRA